MVQNTNSFFDFILQVRDYIVQLIIRGGGKRHHMLTTGVTKILLGEFSDLR